ncbi:GNAT family N-acetyltransferase [Actinoplanes sp. NPDC051411]|uniref:GNAT family N-acetyltransferase n=1 Tax=Actinoplanes sp. NPDC051411 TaxID=3155522 RepID=UPI00343866B9
MALGFVRPARPEDAAEIARIQLSTWRSSYRRMFPPHVLANLDEAYLTRGWSEAIEAAPSRRHRVLIAIEQSDASTAVVGFAAAGPADEQALVPEEPPLADDVAAITDLIIEPRWGRRGHGSRLLAAVVDLWREDGFATAVAWAYEQDKVMQKFLASAGWEPDGAGRALDVDDMLVPQVRFHVALDRDEEEGRPEEEGQAEDASRDGEEE